MQKLETDSIKQVSGGRISMEAAYQKALSHIGADKYRVTVKKNELDTGSAIPKYDIVFTSAGVTYEFFVNADTGQVMGYTEK